MTDNFYVLTEIAAERIRQDKKWGVQNHSLVVWLAILAEEFGEVAMAINEYHFRDDRASKVRAELIQTAAVAVAMIEYIDRSALDEMKTVTAEK